MTFQRVTISKFKDLNYKKEELQVLYIQSYSGWIMHFQVLATCSCIT